MPVRVGVVIPVYNRAALAVEAFGHVCAQTRAPDRLAIVDDGSTDDTEARLAAALAEMKPAFDVEVIQQTNAGASAARNRGAEAVGDCDVIAFYDSDDIWPADFLARAAAAFDGVGEDVVAVSSDRLDRSEATGESELVGCDDVPADAAERFFAVGTPITSATAVRRQAFWDAGGFDAKVVCHNDTDLFLRMCVRGKWGYLPGLPVVIRRDTGEAHLTDGLRSMALRIEIAHVLDRFIHDAGGRDVLPAKVWRVALSRRWQRVGRGLLRRGENGQAAWCFRRSLTIARWRPKAWLLRAMTSGTEPVRPGRL